MAVFIDTAGWLALINRADQLHAQADTYTLRALCSADSP